MVAFFSPFAADLVAGAWHKRPGNKGEFRVASLSLTQFEAASLATKQKDDALTKAYVPDPAQIPAVVGLQLQQGAKPKQARTLAQSQPYWFCPDPLVRITQTEAGKSTTAVPCAFIAKSPTVLKAYSLLEMVQFFSEQSGDDARNLLIASPIASPAPDSTTKVSAFSPWPLILLIRSCRCSSWRLTWLVGRARRVGWCCVALVFLAAVATRVCCGKGSGWLVPELSRGFCANEFDDVQRSKLIHSDESFPLNREFVDGLFGFGACGVCVLRTRRSFVA